MTLSPASSVLVGTVGELWRYPVKSMGAEPLSVADISWQGVAGDRRWAFVRPGSEGHGFPWQTIRERPSMWRYATRLTDPTRPDRSAVEVRTPTGATIRVTDPALAEEIGADVRVMRLDRGLFDAMPLSLITSATVSTLCGLAGVPPNELRFRPNIVVVRQTGLPYVEDDWVGSVLTIGEAAVRIDRRDSRCIIVNVDPVSGRPDAALLKRIPQSRRACAGVYGTTVRPGVVRVGDAVTIDR